MKFITIIFIALFFLSILISTSLTAAFKGEVAGVDSNNRLPQGAGIKNVEGVVRILIEVLKWTYTVFFIIAVLYILFAAYAYLTAQADPEKIKSATNQIIYAAIAIAVALLAVGINAIVKSIIEPSEGSGAGGSSLPAERTFVSIDKIFNS
jgi:hypothetical protein